ncbi:MAG: hypothetical protein Fur002_08020 [Anaerolineales bacterium]
MKKIFFLMAALAFALNACATMARPSAPTGAANPSPLPQVNLQATAAKMAEQTIAAMPTPTLAPSATSAPTETPAPTKTATEPPAPAETLTETPNPAIETLTATLGTGTPFTVTAPAATISATAAAATLGSSSATATQEATYPQTYGTMPPNLPSGKVSIYNSAPKEAYVSIQCETKEGYNSIVEFPLGSKGQHSVKSPAGWCHTVVWVDGKTFSVGFKLSISGNVSVTISKKGVTAK